MKERNRQINKKKVLEYSPNNQRSKQKSKINIKMSKINKKFLIDEETYITHKHIETCINSNKGTKNPSHNEMPFYTQW